MLHSDGTVIAAISELSQSDYRNAVLTDLGMTALKTGTFDNTSLNLLTRNGVDANLFTSGMSDEGLVSSVTKAVGEHAASLGQKALSRSGKISGALENAFFKSAKVAEQAAAAKAASHVGNDGIAGIVQRAVSHYTEGGLNTARTSLRMSMNDNALTGEELKSGIKLLKEKIPDFFSPYKESSEKITEDILKNPNVGDYDRAVVLLKRNFSEKRLDDVISMRDKLRAAGADGFKAIPKKASDVAEATKSGASGLITAGAVVAALAAATAAVVGAKALLSSPPKDGEAKPFLSKVANWVRGIKIPGVKMDVNPSGKLMVNGVEHGKAKPLTDLMAGKSISGNPSGVEGKLKSLKSAFHDIPGQVTSFAKKIIANPSELFHSAKGVAAIMVVGSLIATVLYYVVIGALKLTTHWGKQPA